VQIFNSIHAKNWKQFLYIKCRTSKALIIFYKRQNNPNRVQETQILQLLIFFNNKGLIEISIINHRVNNNYYTKNNIINIRTNLSVN